MELFPSRKGHQASGIQSRLEVSGYLVLISPLYGIHPHMSQQSNDNCDAGIMGRSRMKTVVCVTALETAPALVMLTDRGLARDDRY